jgi:hypothetical protein
MIFPEFNEKNLTNQKNNYSANSWSGYMSDNSLFNSLPVLTNIKSDVTPFSSVFLIQGFKQHLNPSNVFPLLPSFISQPSTVDSLTGDNNKDFDDLLLHFMYGSSFSFFSPSSSFNNHTAYTMFQEEFEAFSKLSLYIFSSPSSFYYSMR